MVPTAEKEKGTFSALKSVFGYKSIMRAPRILKVVVSAGVGSIKDKKKVELVSDRLARITGQMPAARGAKKSIASFKIREGDIVGYQVTLRGKRMYDFIDKLIHIAVPRMRDFHGLPLSAIDEMGNFTIGIREHTIFPETSDEELKDVFGLSVTIVTATRDRKEAEAFLRHIGLPLQAV